MLARAMRERIAFLMKVKNLGKHDCILTTVQECKLSRIETMCILGASRYLPNLKLEGRSMDCEHCGQQISPAAWCRMRRDKYPSLWTAKQAAEQCGCPPNRMGAAMANYSLDARSDSGRMCIAERSAPSIVSGPRLTIHSSRRCLQSDCANCGEISTTSTKRIELWQMCSPTLSASLRSTSEHLTSPCGRSKRTLGIEF